MLFGEYEDSLQYIFDYNLNLLVNHECVISYISPRYDSSIREYALLTFKGISLKIIFESLGDIMTVTFCGHGKYVYGEDVKNQLKIEAEKLINQGAELFYLGGYGKFDGLASEVLTELKEKYPDIKRILVIPYLNRDYYTKNYDETLYPPLENVPFKFCISKRNEWMVKNSEVLVCFIENTYGGAYGTYKYAKRQKIKIINLSKKEV